MDLLSDQTKWGVETEAILQGGPYMEEGRLSGETQKSKNDISAVMNSKVPSIYPDFKDNNTQNLNVELCICL